VQTEIDPRDLIGHKAVDRNGDKIGTIDEVYLDDATGEPEWAAVRTGLFGRDAFVPLTTSEFVSDELRVPYDKSQVKDSPDFGVGQHLSPAQELQLYRYYGLELPAGAGHDGAGTGSGSGSGSGSAAGSETKATGTAAGTTVGTTAGTTAGTAAVPAAAATAGAATAAATELSKPAAEAQGPESTQAMPTVTAPTATPSRTAAFMSTPQSTAPKPAQPPATPAPAPAAASAPATAARPAPEPQTDPLVGRTTGTDAASSAVPEPIEFVCREERLDISTEWSVLGHARLRKYVTSEQVERRVPVVRERIRVERVPVGPDERAQLSDQEITESTEEVTLHEERVIVRKAVVPVERIRLVTERYTEEQVVRDELHREHIQVQDSTRASGPTAVPGNGPAQGSAPSGTPATPGGSSLRPEPFPRTGDTGPYQRPGDTGHAIGA
jgi:uncharacterized protein (TIGR02271 family)